MASMGSLTFVRDARSVYSRKSLGRMILFLMKFSKSGALFTTHVVSVRVDALETDYGQILVDYSIVLFISTHILWMFH